VRKAAPTEAPELSALALRSKGHWGYDKEFLAACREELTVHPSDVEPRRMVVAEADGTVVGFYGLEGDPPEGELGFLFVEPAWIGNGVGRMLWDHMHEVAVACGFDEVMIGADPGAVPFYEAMGAVRIGVVPSASIPGRELPRLVYRFREKT
jgi:GNAT superfamily N-acetyltransferase